MKKRPRPNRGKQTLIAAVVTLVASTALAIVWRSANHDAGNTDNTWVEIKRVRSGDSLLDKDGHKLRLIGVRAPLPDEPFFEQAKQFTEKLTADKTAELRFDEVRADKHGRLLVYLFVDETCLNNALVVEGLAYVRLTSTARRYADELLAAQSEARREKRGIWSQSNATRYAEYWADPKYGNFHGPDCVERVKANPARIVTFGSRDDALEQGFAPCSKCKP